MDFGIVDRLSEAVRRVTPVRNCSGGTIAIERIRTSCGCLRGSAPSEAIPPGKTGEVIFTLYPKGVSGDATYRASVIISKPSLDVITVPVTVSVVSGLIVDPEVVSFGDIDAGAPCREELILHNRLEQPIRLLSITSSSDYVKTDTQSLSIAPDERKTLTVRTGGVPLRKGAFRDVLTIETDCPMIGRRLIPVTGHGHDGPIYVDGHDELAFGIVGVGRKNTLSVALLAILLDGTVW